MMSPSDADPVVVLTDIGFPPSGDVHRITSGWDTLTCRFTTFDGRTHALRLHRAQPDIVRNAEAAAQEALAMRHARAAALPVPEVEYLGAWHGRPALITAWAPGRTLLDLAGSRPGQLPAVAAALGQAQARLHATPPPPGLRVRDTTWIRETIDHAALRDALIRDGRFDTFCHLDFHPINVLAHNGRITAILDWAGAAITDRRADLAFTSTALRLVPLPPSPWRPAFQVARRVFHHYWRKGYEREAGVFLLDPLSLAFGAWHYTRETEMAVAEGRGWVTPSELETLRAQRDQALHSAGLD
ncbi:MAG: phosphotransferase [Dehalococcoidia bacterium]|nr:phosphotransferase [Dehalococcoidia bacterium]MCB9486494.1 phosphotransferase [Thermoflexaceae bacterium]